MLKRILPFVNVFLGLFIFALQVSAMSIWLWDMDKAAVGIWGGVYLVALGGLLFLRKLEGMKLMGAAAIAVAIGATLIGLYSWSISGYQDQLDTECYGGSSNATTTSTKGVHPGYCNRVAVDSMLIAGGILTVLVNGFIAATASSFGSD